MPLAHEGTIPAHVTPCALWGVGAACVAIPPTGWDVYAVVDVTTGGVVDVTATWTPSAPSNENLVVFAWLEVDDGWTPLGSEMGPSPLSWSVEVPDAGTLYVGLAVPYSGVQVDGVGAWVAANAVAQPFVLEGTFTGEPTSEA